MPELYTIEAERVGEYIKGMTELTHKTHLTKQEAIELIENLWIGEFTDEGFEDIDQYFEPEH